MEFRICNLSDARGHFTNWATKTLSIQDSDQINPISSWGDNHLVMVFDDVWNFKDGLRFNADHFDKIASWVRTFQPEDRILIHCGGGVSRSPSVAIGILVMLGRTPIRAVEEIGCLRPTMSPNPWIIEFMDMELDCDMQLVESTKRWEEAHPLDLE